MSESKRKRKRERERDEMSLFKMIGLSPNLRKSCITYSLKFAYSFKGSFEVHSGKK
jgi:hypothetical protein